MNDVNSAYVDWKNWPAGDFGKFDALDAAYFAAETGIGEAANPRVLEIGFGNGSFLGWVRQFGGEVYGVETNPELRARAAALLGQGRAFADLGPPVMQGAAGQFTHIVAFDVIEHMNPEELRAALRRTHDLLAPGGRVILRFPNGDSPFGRVSQHGDPTHLQTIGRQKLEYFAREAGLSVDSVRAPALPARGVGIARGSRRVAIKLGRAVAERVIAILYFGGRRIPLDPNYVAVLTRPT